MPLASRPSWALRMASLLSPSGRLICLEFPLYKEPSTGGPPFGVQKEVYEQHLARPGEDLEYRDGFVLAHPETKPNPKGLICLDRWKLERTHKVGEGTDHTSVWAHP